MIIVIKNIQKYMNKDYKYCIYLIISLTISLIDPLTCPYGRYIYVYIYKREKCIIAYQIYLVYCRLYSKGKKEKYCEILYITRRLCSHCMILFTIMYICPVLY